MTTEATARFVDLVRGPERELAFALDEAALLIAAHATSGLDVAAYRDRLDRLAASAPSADVEDVARHLFVTEGFAGNRDDYADPRNSYLDQVIDRRLGIPISLSVVLMEVGRRLGLPLAGVGMPGHFLVRLEGVRPLFVDPFERGEILDAAGCEARFRDLHGEEMQFEPAFLAPIGPRAILARMLANLRQAYEARSDAGALEWVLRLRTAIPGVPLREQVDFAEVLASRGRFGEAAAALEGLVPHTTESGAEGLRNKAAVLRARLN